ncbi:MAG: hypothetical protein R2781_08695 [Flavobacteriaceae bacterium]
MKVKIGILLSFLFLALPVESQCAMCRAVLESEQSGISAKGINNGIVYLMLFPYLLVGGVGYLIYRMRKKNRREDA